MSVNAPALVRAKIRSGKWRRPTAGLAAGFTQANLVILPAAFAADFRAFCELNSRACPLLDVTDPGSPEARRIAPGSDVRTDVPRYRVYRHGVLTDECENVAELWQSDFVAFLLGCSFTFETALLRAGIPLRHIELGRNVTMFRTTRQCEPAGPFRGPLVVSMRPIPRALVSEVVRITERFSHAHGAPVHIGDPAALGIAELSRPDYGEAVPLLDDDVPVFWACGVTSQAAAEGARPPIMITHAPGYMFVCDLADDADTWDHTSG
jgi:uncharacterized protein YcsI (UPF0317 family)